MPTLAAQALQLAISSTILNAFFSISRIFRQSLLSTLFASSAGKSHSSSLYFLIFKYIFVALSIDWVNQSMTCDT
ncbi:hypothetical protein FGO68_gene454 [Halteria grandinella]|uniref:Uncharacterized protein n=1 Tax=Halteria grandinella TaxID=5974 RepID=A0A8J8NFR5_HALGN|nr:hypothetical protein FGO68_gene454 [Halteria grandinella]